MIFIIIFAIIAFIVFLVMSLRENEWVESFTNAFLLSALLSAIMIEIMLLASLIPHDLCEHSIIERQEKAIESEYVVSTNVDNKMNFIIQVKDEATEFLITETIPANNTHLKIINEGESPKLIKNKTDITNEIIKFFTFRSITEKTEYILCVQNDMIQTSIIIK